MAKPRMLFRSGTKIADNIKNRVAMLIFFQSLSAFLASPIMLLKAIWSILPPSTGPRGRRFAIPMPKLSINTHLKRFWSHITTGYNCLISGFSLILYSVLIPITPRYPFLGFSGLAAAAKL